MADCYSSSSRLTVSPAGCVILHPALNFQHFYLLT